LTWRRCWSALILGLLGGGHCLGMCGGLMGALTLAIPKEQRSRRLRLLLAYNLGASSAMPRPAC
jgi:sulfite exporter TauE/SafE